MKHTTVQTVVQETINCDLCGMEMYNVPSRCKCGMMTIGTKSINYAINILIDGQYASVEHVCSECLRKIIQHSIDCGC